MILTIKDRILINQLFPKEGNLVQQILVRDIVNKTQLTQEEVTESEFKVVNNGYSWNPATKAKEFEFTQAELDLLREQINKLDKEGKITQDLLDLCLSIQSNNIINC